MTKNSCKLPNQEDVALYYKDRATEYDKVYLIPEEQEDLVQATRIFQELFRGKTVLEIACGTGYWTEQISVSANSILATDINESVIEIAKSRENFDSVFFEVADMYSLKPKSKYDALFGGFIWSHILLQDIDTFLHKITSCLGHNGIIAFIDSKQVQGGSHDRQRIAQVDKQGNTYQIRILENGKTYMVLKNFPSQEFLIQKLSKLSIDINYISLEYYWIVSCTVKNKEET